MRVAEVTFDQAAVLDPALLLPDTAIAVRFGSVRAFIGPLPPADAPAPMLVGELRFDDARPLGFFRPRGGHEPGLDAVRAAPATRDGLARLLTALNHIATHQKLAPAPTAKTGTP